MSDTAAFFASKKKKKKAFKGFNANKIDASTVTSKVHVDAPALSTDGDVAAGVGATLASTSLGSDADKKVVEPTREATTAASGSQGEEWDDEAMNKTPNITGTIAKSSTTSELMDMKALERKRNEEDDIAERMRVEETRAKLAAAREGMEREAERIKKEKQDKQAGKQQPSTGKPRFGAAAAAASSGDSSRWVPPHLRAGGAATLSRVRMGASGSQNVDTQDENLFPDLNAADQILEQQKQQQMQSQVKAAAAKKPTAPTWGVRASGGAASALASKKPAAPSVRKTETAPLTPMESQGTTAEPKPAVAPKKTAGPTTGSKEAAAAAGGGLKKKKKKKDLSTFKASS